MNFTALFIFVSSISIMLRPTQAQGKFENLLIFSLTAFKSHFGSHFVYLNTHLPGLAFQTLPVEFVISFPVYLFFSFMYSYFPVFIKNWHFKIPIWPRIRVCLGFVWEHPNIFIQLKFAKTTQNCDKKNFLW